MDARKIDSRRMTSIPKYSHHSRAHALSHVKCQSSTTPNLDQRDENKELGIWGMGGVRAAGIGGIGMITIEALRKDLLVRVSGGGFRRLLKTLLTITLLCPILAVSCHPTLLRRSPSALAHQEDEAIHPIEPHHTCLSDGNCVPGYFCHGPTKSCVPCLAEECLKWKRLRPAPNICIKAQENCGNCLPGYADEHGHCQPITAHRTLNQGKGNRNDSSSVQGHAGEEKEPDSEFPVSTLGVLLGLIVGLVLLLSTSIPLIIYFLRIRRRNRPTISKSSYPVGGREEIPCGEYFQRPPPYNPSMAGHAQAPPLHEHPNDLENSIANPLFSPSGNPPRPFIRHAQNLSMAIPFRTGQFPTLPTEAEEEEIPGSGEDEEGSGPSVPNSPAHAESRSESDEVGPTLELPMNEESGEVRGEEDAELEELEVEDPPLLEVVYNFGGGLAEGNAEDRLLESPPFPLSFAWHNWAVLDFQLFLNYQNTYFSTFGGGDSSVDLSDADTSYGLVPTGETSDLNISTDQSFYS